jgi:hypothetical protein
VLSALILKSFTEIDAKTRSVTPIEDWLNEHNKQAAATALQKIGIVLSYAFDMQESDSLMASLDFEQLLTKGSFTFNPNAGDSLKRENRRAFTIADNYQTLKQMRCAAERPDQYPIVGTIGIDERYKRS